MLKRYLAERVYPRLGKKAFTVLYVHTGVQRSENFAGISALRSIYDAIPANVKENLQAVYFVHPGLQARLFLATFGRLFFNGVGGYVSLLPFFNFYYCFNLLYLTFVTFCLINKSWSWIIIC